MLTASFNSAHSNAPVGFCSPPAWPTTCPALFVSSQHSAFVVRFLQGYWQSAIAARPSAAHTGYLLGGIMWFCIPFTLATTMGLAALAADLPITIAEAGAGDTSARKQFHTHVLERPHSGHHLRMLPELQSF